LRPGNAETPITLFPDLPDTLSAPGTQAPRARRLTATRSPHRTFKWAQHLPRGGRLLGSQNSKQTPQATWRKESWHPRYHHNKQTPQRDPAAPAANQARTSHPHDDGGTRTYPPLQDHARTQLQGPRDPGTRLILPQMKPSHRTTRPRVHHGTNRHVTCGPGSRAIRIRGANLLALQS
jgi:hypothetical protein